MLFSNSRLINVSQGTRSTLCSKVINILHWIIHSANFQFWMIIRDFVYRTIQFQSGATYLALVCFPNSTVVVMTTLIPTEFLIMIFQFESLVLHNAGFHQPYVDFHFYWVSNSVQFKIVSRFDLLFNTNDSIAFAYNQLVDRPEFKDLSFCKIIWQVLVLFLIWS